MIVSHKPYKKKVILPSVPIIEKEEELYAKIYHSNQDIVDTNHTLLQIPKQELVKIF